MFIILSLPLLSLECEFPVQYVSENKYVNLIKSVLSRNYEDVHVYAFRKKRCDTQNRTIEQGSSIFQVVVLCFVVGHTMY